MVRKEQLVWSRFKSEGRRNGRRIHTKPSVVYYLGGSGQPLSSYENICLLSRSHVKSVQGLRSEVEERAAPSGTCIC